MKHQISIDSAPVAIDNPVCRGSPDIVCMNRVLTPGDPDYPTSKALQKLLANRAAVAAQYALPQRDQPTTRLLTATEAAQELGTSDSWVITRLQAGVKGIDKTALAENRHCIASKEMEQLREFWEDHRKMALIKKSDLLGVIEAANLAGVANTTLTRWGKAGEVKRYASPSGWLYLRSAVLARAKFHFKEVQKATSRAAAGGTQVCAYT